MKLNWIELAHCSVNGWPLLSR